MYGAQSFDGWVLSSGTEVRPSALQLAEIGSHCVVDLLQENPLAQSVSVAQAVLHFVASQLNFPHDFGLGEPQAPIPSQTAAGVSVPALHDPAAHSFSRPLANTAHLVRSFVASHPSALQTSPPPSAHFIRLPCGAPLTPSHFPSLPATSHASH